MNNFDYQFNTVKNVYIKFNNWLLLFGAVICIPLHNYAGLVLFPLYLWIVISTSYGIRKRDIFLVIILAMVAAVQMILTYDGNLGAYIRFFISILGFYGMFLQKGIIDQKGEMLQWKKQGYSILYWITFSICVEEVIRYIVFVLQYGWHVRNVHKYLGDMHVVDFSVILIFCFLVGMKTKHTKSTICFVCFNMLFYPARTYKLFIILFVLCYLFYNIIAKIRKNGLFNSYFKIIIWLLIATLIFSSIWVYYLSFKYPIKAKYESWFDVSNQERFETILYGFKVIASGNFWFRGMQRLDLDTYINMIDYTGFHGVVLTIPHNTYLLIMVRYSVILSVLYLLVFTRLSDRFKSRMNVTIVLSYLIICCILHDLLMDARALMLLSVLFIPEFKNTRRSLLIKSAHTKIGRIPIFRVKI